MIHERQNQRITSEITNDLTSLILYLILLANPIILTFVFINLVGIYWAYYDIGINSSANSITLLLFVAPLMLILFGITETSIWFLVSKKKKHIRLQILYTFLGSMVLFIGSFLFQVWLYADYPSPIQHNLAEFFVDLVTPQLR